MKNDRIRSSYLQKFRLVIRTLLLAIIYAPIAQLNKSRSVLRIRLKVWVLLGVQNNIDTIIGNLPDDYRVSPGGGSIPPVSASKASVGDNKSLVRCNLFEEGEASYLVITSKRLVFNRRHFSNPHKNKWIRLASLLSKQVLIVLCGCTTGCNKENLPEIKSSYYGLIGQRQD